MCKLWETQQNEARTAAKHQFRTALNPERPNDPINICDKEQFLEIAEKFDGPLPTYHMHAHEYLTHNPEELEERLADSTEEQAYSYGHHLKPKHFAGMEPEEIETIMETLWKWGALPLTQETNDSYYSIKQRKDGYNTQHYSHLLYGNSFGEGRHSYPCDLSPGSGNPEFRNRMFGGSIEFTHITGNLWSAQERISID